MPEETKHPCGGALFRANLESFATKQREKRTTREKSKSELAKEHGVSRPTMDKLLREYERDMLAKRKGTV